MDRQIIAQLVIVLDDAGSINVNGPIENELLTFGLLEKAKQAVIDHNKKAKSPIVTLPPGTHLKQV